MAPSTKSMLLAGLAVSWGGLTGWSAPLAVRTVHTAGWAQGDPVHAGAEEFMVLLEVTRLTRDPGHAGLIGVGDRRGLFAPGAEAALQRAVLLGVPVVKLAAQGRVLPAPHGLFLDGSGLTEAEARAVLERCVARHGSLPVTGEAAASADLARLHERLQAYQQEFTLAAVTRLALR